MARKLKRYAKHSKVQTTRLSVQPARTGLLYKALPTHREVHTKLRKDGQPDIIYPGRISLTDQIALRLEEVGHSYWHPDDKGIGRFRPNWIINMLADPDHYPHALEALDKALKERPVPVLNHPYAVLKTRRNLVWRELKDVPNLIAPKCVRFLATHPNHFIQAFEKAEFSYPVIVRPTGSHTGKEMLFIESQADWPKIYTIPWGGREIYMTQWVSFQSNEGHWRKLRLCITPDRIGLRHILFGDGWLVHAMERGAEEVERELDILKGQDDWAVLQQIGKDIRKRLGMDFCGVDLGYKSEGEFVLFEANASMSILSRANTPEYRQKEYFANLERLDADVWRAMSRTMQLGDAGTTRPA